MNFNATSRAQNGGAFFKMHEPLNTRHKVRILTWAVALVLTGIVALGHFKGVLAIGVQVCLLDHLAIGLRDVSIAKPETKHRGETDDKDHHPK